MIPILVTAYNRPKSLSRILKSLKSAHYPKKDITLIISLDNNGPNGTLSIANDFNWEHGEKLVLQRKNHLGMKAHSFACLELLKEYEFIIFLEDDSFVGRHFYSYAEKSAKLMSSNNDIFATSLYSFDYCEYDDLKFSPIPSNSPGFLMKSATTWGTLFSFDRWEEFISSFRQSNLDNEDNYFIPSAINRWPKTSWKKYINRYLSISQKYFLYPYFSHLTHFADPGTHFDFATENFQVPTLNIFESQEIAYFSDSNFVIRYDEFWELEPPKILTEEIGVDFEFDIRRIKNINQYRKPFVFTSRPVKKFIKSYGADFFPRELNLIEDNAGDLLFLARSSDVLDSKMEASPQEIRHYMKNIGTAREIKLAADSVIRKIFSASFFRLRRTKN